MAMFQALNISATGMTAQRLRMDILSENIANVKTCLLYTSDAADD